MKLKAYMDSRKLVVKDLRRGLLIRYGDAPAASTLQKIVARENIPQLELAVMIVVFCKGMVGYEDLLVPAKCKFIEVVDAETPTKKIPPDTEEKQVATEAEREAADKMDELMESFL